MSLGTDAWNGMKRLLLDDRSSGSSGVSCTPGVPPDRGAYSSSAGAPSSGARAGDLGVSGAEGPTTIREVWRARSLRELATDQGGAIMVMGVFMAVMLVGMLYYLIGIGDTIVYRERLQDAADSAAFASAVLHARGMNFIALINIIMAALLAILVALKLIETLATIAIIAIFAIVAASFGTASGLLSLVPPLNTVRSTAQSAYNSLRSPILRALSALDTAQEVIARGMPIVAGTRVVALTVDTYAPTTEFGFPWPLYEPLPVEDDGFDRLCEEAGETAAHFALLPFFFLPNQVKSRIEGAVGRLTRTFSGYFCGSAGRAPPPRQCTGEPPPPAREDPPTEPPCEEEDRTMLMPDNPDGDALACVNNDFAACDRHTEWYLAGNRCLETGSPPESCSGFDRTAFEQRAAAGASQCRPGDGVESFAWLEQTFEITETWEWVWDDAAHTSGHWDYEQAAPEPSGSSRQGTDDSSPPCGHDDFTGYGAGFGEPSVCYERFDLRGCNCPGNSHEGACGATPSRTRFTTECADGAGQPSPLEGGPERYEHVVRYLNVNSIVSCSRVMDTSEVCPGEEQLFPPGGGPGSPGGGTSGGSSSCDMCPDKVQDCAKLGEDMFQLRAFAVGDPSPLRRAPQGVRVAAWGGDGGDVYESITDIASRISFAQAEFFYSSRESEDRPRSEWMWHMYWTARMRRFRIDSMAGCDRCPAGVGSFVQEAQNIIIH